jgi:hypothetical protein
MSHDTLLDLSRWQWALTAAFHITFPALTVGTSIFLVVSYYMYMRTDDEVWLRMFRFWRRIFAIGFALGVVSGIVLTFEFGLNWGRFAHDVGPIVGVLIAMEVVTAFFLEAGFLGLLVYGDGRVSKRVMMFSTCMVSLGTLLSVTWILVANSWMQTPDGYKEVAGQFQPTNWLHVIFNPSFGIRFVHMLVGALIAAAWFIAGVSAVPGQAPASADRAPRRVGHAGRAGDPRPGADVHRRRGGRRLRLQVQAPAGAGDGGQLDDWVGGPRPSRLGPQPPPLRRVGVMNDMRHAVTSQQVTELVRPRGPALADEGDLLR